MKDRKMKSSVATRTTLLIVVVVMAILLTSGLWQMQHVRSIISDEVHHQAARSMEGAVKVIENRIANVETAVQMAASYANLFAFNEEDCYTLMQRLVASDKDITSVTLMYRADFFSNHGRYYAPCVWRNTAAGTLEKKEIGGPEHHFSYLENDSNWICTNRLNAGYWCRPYNDTIVTKLAMVSYSVPLHDNHGKIYAVLCANVALDWVQRVIDRARPYPYSDVIVLARDSQYVCHPIKTWVQNINVFNHARELNNKAFTNLTERMLRGEKGVDTLDNTFHPLSTTDDDYRDSKTLVFYAPIPHVNWSVSFSIPEKKMMELPNRLRVSMVGLLVFLLILISVVLWFIIRAQLRPLKMLSASALEVAKGNFHAQLPVILRHDEIGQLRDSFEEMQQSLSKYIEELKETTASKASMESELRIASNIQKTMIPKDFPAFPERDDIDIYGLLTPAREVGGDLFDFYIRDEKLFFCIGDVSGKGVPASLVMAVTRTLFRTVSAHEAIPDRIISRINDAICLNNDTNMFVTIVVGVIDLQTGRLRFCNAGHNAPLLIGSGVGLLPCNPNIPVGVMTGWKYVTEETYIDPQTTIFLYTDGLAEAEDTSHELFGEQRVLTVAQSLEDHTPEATIHKMKEAVSAFVGTAPQSDDLTMLAIQYTNVKYQSRMQRSVTLPNDVGQVPRLHIFVDEVCEMVGFDMTTTMQMNLAIEEAVVNVMNYAYPEGTKGNVNIVAMANDKRVKFVISDSGTPFDPTAKADADTTLSAEERPIGGLGIYLVRQLMDSVNYERRDGLNILTLRKSLNMNDD